MTQRGQQPTRSRPAGRSRRRDRRCRKLLKRRRCWSSTRGWSCRSRMSCTICRTSASACCRTSCPSTASSWWDGSASWRRPFMRRRAASLTSQAPSSWERSFLKRWDFRAERRRKAATPLRQMSWRSWHRSTTLWQRCWNTAALRSSNPPMRTDWPGISPGISASIRPSIRPLRQPGASARRTRISRTFPCGPSREEPSAKCLFPGRALFFRMRITLRLSSASWRPCRAMKH